MPSSSISRTAAAISVLRRAVASGLRRRSSGAGKPARLKGSARLATPAQYSARFAAAAPPSAPFARLPKLEEFEEFDGAFELGFEFEPEPGCVGLPGPPPGSTLPTSRRTFARRPGG